MNQLKKLSIFKNVISENLRKPRKGPIGWYLTNYFFKKNRILMRNAIKFCDIQPNHKVLEIGCGPGYGLLEAAKYIKDGNGTIYGVDISDYMIKECEKLCQDLISNNKVEVFISSVEHMSFDNDFFDSVFHTNCYYFWSDLDNAIQEIVRVMKPGSYMITTLNLNALKEFEKHGFFQSGNPDPVRYMSALEMNGFENVEFKYENDHGFAFQVIFAKLRQKENIVDIDKFKV